MISRTREEKFQHRGSEEKVQNQGSEDDCVDPLLGIKHLKDS